MSKKVNYIQKRKIYNLLKNIQLRSNKVIKDEDFKKLFDMYVNDPRNFFEIQAELFKIMAGEISIQDKLVTNKSSDEKKKELDEIKKEAKKELKMDDITDLKMDDKRYIMMKYSDGTHKIIENNSKNNGKEIFEIIQDSMKSISLEDDFIKRSVEIFESLVKTNKEVPLVDIKNVDTNYVESQYEVMDQKKLSYVKESFPNKNILASPQNNIYILSQIGEEDITVRVDIVDNIYKIKTIERINYESNNSITGSEVTKQNETGNLLDNESDSKSNSKKLVKATANSIYYGDSEGY